MGPLSIDQAKVVNVKNYVFSFLVSILRAQYYFCLSILAQSIDLLLETSPSTSPVSFIPPRCCARNAKINFHLKFFKTQGSSL